MFFSNANFQHSQKHNIVMNSIDTRFFQKCFWSRSKTRSTCFIGSKTTWLRLVVLQYRANVSWQSLETRTSRLDPRSSKLESFEYRGSSRVHRVSRQGNKELFAWLVFRTSYPRPQWVRFLFTGTTCISAEMRLCWSGARTCMLEMERVRSPSVLSVPCRLQPKLLCVLHVIKGMLFSKFWFERLKYNQA